MKILAMRVDWALDCGNLPVLEILVDRIPDHKEMIYQKKIVGRGSAYFSEKDGYVHFLWHNPRHEVGYGGDKFTLQVIQPDGTTCPETFKGPWSSRCECMNEMGFIQSVRVFIGVVNEHNIKHWRIDLNGAITLSLAKESMKSLLPGIELYRDGYNYTPTLIGKTVQESKEHLRK